MNIKQDGIKVERISNQNTKIVLSPMTRVSNIHLFIIYLINKDWYRLLQDSRFHIDLTPTRGKIYSTSNGRDIVVRMTNPEEGVTFKPASTEEIILKHGDSHCRGHGLGEEHSEDQKEGCINISLVQFSSLCNFI